MKTTDLARDNNGTVISLELSEFELTILVALVEQGKLRLESGSAAAVLHKDMKATANEFCSLLGHLELLAADD